jgi:tRNA 2-thiouridine synthesizing protein A
VTRQRRAARAAAAAAATRSGTRAPVAGGPVAVPGSRSPVRHGITPPPVLTLDALGKKCPIPIIMLADKIRDVPVGQTIEVLADDPAAKTDLPAWCALKSQEFVSAANLPAGWSFLIRRSY